MSNLTVSDWVTFLSNERGLVFSSVLNLGAILIAFIAIVFGTRIVGLWQEILNGIVTLVFVIYAFRKVFRPFGKRGEVCGQILKKIIAGELLTSEEIQKEWLSSR